MVFTEEDKNAIKFLKRKTTVTVEKCDATVAQVA